jgi:hypothetical protein
VAGQPKIGQVLCVALVAAIMVPVGRWIFPFLSAEIGRLQFEAIEALTSAALGFCIYTVVG